MWNFSVMQMIISIMDFLINARLQTVYYCGVAVYTNVSIPRKFTKLEESTGRTVHPGIMSWVFIYIWNRITCLYVILFYCIKCKFCHWLYSELISFPRQYFFVICTPRCADSTRRLLFSSACVKDEFCYLGVYHRV